MSAHSLDPEAQEIYRDRWLLVLDKPAGLASQAGRDGGPSLYDAVRAREPYAALHHRLDTPASGLILLALDREANPALAEGFRERTISRVYLAAALGDPGEQGRWAEALDGRPAATRWRRLGARRGMCALELRLETGRTHQIRRHAAGAGHPLLGDRRYGGAAGRAWPRLALHAWRLTLAHPVTGAPLSLEAPPPPDLAPLLIRAGAPAETWAGPEPG